MIGEVVGMIVFMCVWQSVCWVALMFHGMSGRFAMWFSGRYLFMAAVALN